MNRTVKTVDVLCLLLSVVVNGAEKSDSGSLPDLVISSRDSYWQLIRDWVAAGVNSYSAWNMILDTYGMSLAKWPQNALLLVDRSAKTLVVTPAYWTFRHFSQYIAPGATRIEAVGSSDALAFKNPDGRIITQVCNKEDAAKTVAITAGGTLYRFEIPVHGWATLSVPPATAVEDVAQKAAGGRGLRITGRGEHCRLVLPSGEPGRCDLLTVTGRILESRAISPGCRELHLGEQAYPAGLLLVRVVCGGTVETVRCVGIR